MRYMLDTNICIYAIKHKPEKVFLKLQEVEPEDVCVSSVTYAELVHGVEKSVAVEKNRSALRSSINSSTEENGRLIPIPFLASSIAFIVSILSSASPI